MGEDHSLPDRYIFKYTQEQLARAAEASHAAEEGLELVSAVQADCAILN